MAVTSSMNDPLDHLEALSRKAEELKAIDVCGSKFERGFYDLICLVQDLAKCTREVALARQSDAISRSCMRLLEAADVKEPIVALKDERDRYRAALTAIAAGRGKQATRAARALLGEDVR